jgi:hypothetical protein
MLVKRVKTVYGVRLMAPNDPSGNPRRCWVVFNVKGERIDVIDEGYDGESAFTRAHPGGVMLMSVRVAYAPYHQALTRTPVVPRREP